MPLGNSVINLAVNVRDNDVDSLRRSLSNVKDKLNDVSKANLAASQAAEKSSRSHEDLAQSAGEASGGLGILQSQLLSTAAAQEALEDSSEDLADALDGLEGQSEAKALDAITQGIQRNIDSIESLDDTDAEILNDFNTGELKDFLRVAGDASDADEALDRLLSSRNLDFSTDEIEDIRSVLYSILSAGDDANFRDLFGEGAPKEVERAASEAKEAFDAAGDFERADIDIIESLDDDQFERFKQLAGLSGDISRGTAFDGWGDIDSASFEEIDRLASNIDESFRNLSEHTDEISDLDQSELSGLLRMVSGVRTNTVGGKPLDPTADIEDELKFSPHTMYELSNVQGIDTFEELLNSDLDDVESRLDAGLLPAGDEGRFEDLVDNDTFPDLMQRDLEDADIDTVDEFFQKSDRELLTVSAMMDRSALADATPAEMRRAVFENLKQTDKVGAGESGMERGRLERLLRPIGTHPDIRPESESGSDAVQQLQQFAGQNQTVARILRGIEESDAFGLGDIGPDLRQLQAMADENSRLDEILSSDDINNVNQLINFFENNVSGDESELIERAAAGEFTDTFGDLERHTDNIPGVETASDVQETIKDRMNLSQSRGESGKGLKSMQAEVLSNLVGDMKSSLPGDTKGLSADVPMSREVLEMGLMQELMESQSDERREAIQNLLQNIYTGQITTGDEISPSMLQNDQMFEEQFAPAVSRALPDDLDDDTKSAIAQRFRETNAPLTEFIGEDSARGISGTVDEVLEMEGFSGDKQNILTESTEGIERAIRDVLFTTGTQAAPNVIGGLELTEEDIDNLFPNRDALTETQAIEDRDVVPGTNVSRARYSAVQSHLDDLQDTIEKYDEIEEKQRLLFGTAGSQTFTGRRREPGVMSAILGATPVFAKGLNNIDGVGVNATRATSKMSDVLKNTREKFSVLDPIIDATSVNLGAFNVRVGSMIGLVSRLTALLGPAISGLVGLAGAALTASAAFGSFLAVGALDLLDQMERSMAGVSNRQEAVEELTENIREMAEEALTPLSNATLADGRDGTQAFIDTIRGGIRILNRFARVMAAVVSMPVVVEQFGRLADVLFGSGDSELIENLREATELGLPIFMDMLIGLITQLDDFIAYGSKIANELGPPFLNFLGNVKPILALLIAFGTGFAKMLLFLANNAAVAISTLIALGDAIPLVDINQTAVALGGLVAALKSVSVAARLAGFSMSLLSMSTYTVVAALLLLIDTIKIFLPGQESMIQQAIDAESAFGRLAAATAQLIVTIGALTAAYSVLQATFVAGGVIGTLATIATKASVAAQILYGFGAALASLTSFGMLGLVAKWIGGAILTGLVTAGKAALGLVTAFVSIKAAILLVVAILADFVVYLVTGESAAERLLRKLEQITGIDAFGGLADDIQWVYSKVVQIHSELAAMHQEFLNGPIARTLRGGPRERNVVDKIGARKADRTGVPGGGNQTAKVEVNVDASRSQGDLERMIGNQVSTILRHNITGR